MTTVRPGTVGVESGSQFQDLVTLSKASLRGQGGNESMLVSLTHFLHLIYSEEGF